MTIEEKVRRFESSTSCAKLFNWKTNFGGLALCGAIFIGGPIAFSSFKTYQASRDLENWLPKGEVLAVKHGVSKERYERYVRHHGYFTSEIGVGWDCQEIKRLEEVAQEEETSFADASEADGQAQAQAESDQE